MKPIDFNKKAAKNIARVNMFIKAHLSWLYGYPYHLLGHLVWVRSESGSYFDKYTKVDAQIISKAQRTVNTLYRDYPVALPAVVGDAKVWHKRCCEYIKHAKDLINSNSDIYSLYEKDKKFKNILKIKLSTQHQHTAASQLSWMHFINRKGINKSLQFFNEFHQISNKIDLQDLINLINVFKNEPIKSKPFIKLALLAIPNSSTFHIKENLFAPYLTSISHKNFKKRRDKFKPANWPSNKNQQVFISCMEELNTVKASQKRRFLDFFEVLSLDKLIIQWHKWWEISKTLSKKIENHLTLGSGLNIDEIKSQQRQLAEHVKQRPARIKLNEIIDALFHFSQDVGISAALKEMLQSIELIEANHPSAMEFLLFFKRIHEIEKPKNKVFIAYLNGLNDFLLTVQKEDEHPWDNIPKLFWNCIDADLLEKANATQVKAFFETLTLIHSNLTFNLKPYHLETALRAIIEGMSHDEIAHLLSAINDKEITGGMPASVIRISYQLGLSSKDSIRLLKLHKALFNEDTWVDELESFFDIIKELNLTAFFKNSILSLDDINVLRTNYLIKVIKKSSGINLIPKPSEIGSKNDKWIKEYPDIFKKLILNLNAISSKAQRQVNEIFKSVWWTKSMIQSEVDQLTAIKPLPNENHSIDKRLDNLNHKYSKHKAITDNQIKKIKRKLLNKVNQEHFANWERVLEKQFKLDWCSLFGIEPENAPNWLLDSNTVGKLINILDFEPPSKSLAIKVIQSRMSGKYYYLKNDNKNKAFIKSIEQEGVDFSNWPDKFNSYTYDAANGENVTIEFEPDPLELLDMGAHFGTCLSPGGMNYFSVFANIADANKFVIYARNQKNKVIGRVLIGITKQGGLQVFNQYTHHKDYEFKKYVQAFINKVAKQSNLIVTKTGKVRPLCGTEWYDDGAKDVNHEINCFKDNSPFRKKIQSLSSTDFLTELTNALHPKKINSITFSILINIPEIKANKNLFEPLTQLLLSIPNISNSDLISFYKLANGYGYGAECFELHRNRFMKYFNKRIKDSWINYYEIEMISKHHPSDALKLIKADAKNHKANWKDKPVYEAIKATTVALESLGRNKLANKIANSKNFV